MTGEAEAYIRARRPRIAMIIAVCALTTLPTTPSSPQAAAPAGDSEMDPFGTAIRASKWPTNTIEVCWERSGTSDEASRAAVRTAVADTWERASGVRFVGWGTCGDARRGIRIEVDDVAPHTEQIGRFLDGRPRGMVLNFVFERWGGACRDKRDFCLRATAVHEFGHALGFTHEQNRREASVRCQEKARGSVGDYAVTRYDLHSIMNYCNPRWLGDGRLSELDVRAVRKFYP